jgi:tetratricopeptide (TPR) repeat protein
MHHAPRADFDPHRSPMTEPPAVTQLAVELQERAWALQADGKLDEAFIACSEALTLIEAAEGSGSPDAANLLNDLADIERERLRYHSALAFAKKAHAIETALGDRFTGDTAAHIRMATLSSLGDLWRLLGQYEQAEGHLERALAIGMAAYGEASEEVAEARNSLAVLYKFWGRFAAARKLYEQSLLTMTALHGPRSLPVSVILHNIGGVMHAQGDFAAAEEPGRKAWEMSRELLGDDDPRAMLDAAAYASILDGLERFDESEPIHLRVLEFMTRKHGPEHYEVASTLHNLAAVLDARGRADEAEQHYRSSIAIKERLLSDGSPDLALTYNNLGRLLHSIGRSREAASLLEKAVATLELQLPSDHPHLLAAQRNLRQALGA